jgi:hypothetical protein
LFKIVRPASGYEPGDLLDIEEEKVNPMLKRAIAAVAVKKAWDKYQEARRPQRPSLWARLGIPAAVLAAGGTIAFLGKTGRLQPVVNQVRGRPSRGEAASGPTPAPTT